MNFLSTNSTGMISGQIPSEVINELSNSVKALLESGKSLSEKVSSEYIVFDHLNRLIYLSSIEKIIQVKRLKKYLESLISNIVFIKCTIGN